ncbi:hypothetical protein EYF80_013927 [Liparis tanakae]|uniref:Uncharacterized protein n=1 Tax=Liparis tanakae TaxID=230148 RepID=A0A4Z2ICV5_9TELE|nr:hypothetical protein EYF80_013927 [Liparis tanakae]
MIVSSEEELWTQEDAAWEQTPERRLVEVLLDISEEDFVNELEPHEYHCYAGWEDAKGDRKSKPASPADRTLPDAARSPSVASDPRCESRVGLQNHGKKHTPLSQHAGPEAALQKDCSEWPFVNSVLKTPSKPPLREKPEREGPLRETPSQPLHLHSRYPAHRATQLVPIQNFTFLPPIIPSSLNSQKAGGQLCCGNKAREGETAEETHFLLDARSGPRGARAEHVANPELPTCSAVLTSRYWTCPRNPHLFSALSVAIPERYRVPMSSKPDTVHRASYQAARGLTQALLSGTASGGHLYPTTVHLIRSMAVRLPHTFTIQTSAPGSRSDGSYTLHSAWDST